MLINGNPRLDQLSKSARYILGSLLLLIAINAFAGGYYGMAGAKNIPVAWLDGTPFSSYLIPSLFLFLIIGGTSLIAAIAVFKKYRSGIKIAFFSGIIIILWLLVQLMMIGYVSWMQPVTASVAVIIIFLTSRRSTNAF